MNSKQKEILNYIDDVVGSETISVLQRPPTEHYTIYTKYHLKWKCSANVEKFPVYIFFAILLSQHYSQGWWVANLHFYPIITSFIDDLIGLIDFIKNIGFVQNWKDFSAIYVFVRFATVCSHFHYLIVKQRCTSGSQKLCTHMYILIYG